MTVDDLIEELSALKRKDAAAGALTVVAYWQAEYTADGQHPILVLEEVEIAQRRAVLGGRHVRVVALTGA